MARKIAKVTKIKKNNNVNEVVVDNKNLNEGEVNTKVNQEEKKEEIKASNDNQVNVDQKAKVETNNMERNSMKEKNDITKKKKENKSVEKVPPFKSGISKAKVPEREKSTDVNKNPSNEILLKKVVPEIDLTIYSFPYKTIQNYKFFFRYFYDNRMNFLLHAKRKGPNPKQVSTKSDLVFKPKLNTKTLKAAENYRKKCFDQINKDYNMGDSNEQQQGNVSNKLRLEEVYNILKLKRENEIARLKLQQNDEMLKQCTFQPNSNISKSPKINTSDVSKRLFNDSAARITKKKKDEDVKKEADNKPLEYSFQPEVHSFNTDLFSEQQQIHGENAIKKKYDRYERARIERKLCELQKKKGIINLKNTQNIENLIKEEDLPGMKFSIEKKKHIKIPLKSENYKKRIAEIPTI